MFVEHVRAGEESDHSGVSARAGIWSGRVRRR
jgi:hypothetical protein